MNRRLAILLLIAVFAAAIGTVFSGRARAQAPPQPYTVTLPDGSTVLASGVLHPVGTRQIVLLAPSPRIFSGSFE